MDFKPEPRSADGLRYECMECSRERGRRYHTANKATRNAMAKQRRAENPERDRKYNENYRRKFVWRGVFQHAKKRAARFGWAFDLDQHLEVFKARIERMTCEMTGVTLVPGGGAGNQGKRYWNTVSLDRIEPDKGYTIRNVRIVCWAMNCAMGTWGEAVLKELMATWINKG